MYLKEHLSHSNRTPTFSSIVELNVSISAQVLISVNSSYRHNIVVRDTDAVSCRRCYEDLPISVHVDILDRFAGNLDASTSGIGAICGSIASCHGNTSTDVINSQSHRILLNIHSQRYGIIYVIESDYK